jgi:hypothetical protein
MSSKTTVTRTLAAIAVLLLANGAFAKDTKKKAAESSDDKKGGMMEDSGKDPAETETAGDDEGQFVPGKKKKAQQGDAEEGEGEESAESEVIKKAQPKQPDEAPPPPPPKHITARKTVGFYAEALFGFGKTPIPGPQNPTSSSLTSVGLQVGAHLDVTTALRLQLRVPYTLTSFQDSSVNELGTPEIAGRLRLTAPGTTEWAVRLGIGIPVAQGTDVTNIQDANGVAQQIGQYAASAANGYHDPELYMTKRLPISPSLLYTHRMESLRLNGELKAVIAPNVGGSITDATETGAGTGTFKMNGVAVDALLGFSASYEFVKHFFGALAVWGEYQISREVVYSSGATGPSNFQFAIEPKLLAQFGPIVPSVGFVLPIGGELGGNIVGLRLHVDAVF